MNILKESDLTMEPEALAEWIHELNPVRVIICHEREELDYLCVLRARDGIVAYIGTREAFAKWLAEEEKIQ